MAVFILLNGYPGVGKLAIACQLCKLIPNAKVLSNHLQRVVRLLRHTQCVKIGNTSRFQARVIRFFNHLSGRKENDYQFFTRRISNPRFRCHHIMKLDALVSHTGSSVFPS